MTILIVDDHPTDRRLLRVTLQAEGHSVVEAGDGVEALQLLGAKEVDMVISDILMPRMDGFQLCREIKKNEALKQLPFVFYSGTYIDPEDREFALSLGADLFVAKPAQPEAFVQALDEAIKTAASSHPAPLPPELEEEIYLKEYNERLVRKLEEKELRLREINKTLAASDRRLRTIIEKAPECIKVIARDGTLLEMNPAGLAMIEAESADEVVGNTVYGIIAPEHRDAFRRLTEQVFQGAEGTLDFEVVGLKGTRRWLTTKVVPLFNDRNEVAASLGITRDITGDRQKQELLQESEEKFRQIAENIREVFWMTDPEKTRMLYISPAYEKIWGRSCESLYDAPLSFLEAIHPEDRARVEGALRNQIDSTFEEEYRIIRPDGSLRWIRDRAFPVRNRAGEVYRIVGIAEDITERKLAEQEKERNLGRIRALHEIERAISSTLDLKTVLYVLLQNLDQFLAFPTVSAVRLIQENGALDTVACRNLDLDLWIRQFHESAPAAAVIATRAPVMIRDLRSVPQTTINTFCRRHGLASYLGLPLLAKDQLLGVLCVFTREQHEFNAQEVEFLMALAGQAAIAIHNAQLYERTKRQSRELEEMAANLRRREQTQTLLKELNQDITTMDLKSLLQKLTAAGRAFLGVDICDIRVWQEKGSRVIAASGIAAEKLESIPRQGRTRMKAYVENKQVVAVYDLASDSSRQSERSTVRTLGIRGYLGAPFFSKNGQILGVIRALTYSPREFSREDVELLEHLANGAAIAIENARLYHELERSNRVKSEFLGVMSHELRTPLNIIMGFAGLLEEQVLGSLHPAQKDALAKITSQSNHLLSMITSILEATKIESGATVFETESIDLTAAIEELKQECDPPPEKELSLVWHCPPDLPELITDGRKLKTILRNLIGNAIKFTERGTVTVSVRVGEAALAKRISPEESSRDTSDKTRATSHDLRATTYVEFTVQDTGIGIARENLPSIFDMFRQVDSSDTRLYGGVGLGLYIAKKYAEMLGATIDVESEVGKGSMFTVRIPVTRTED
ncbi:MAG TPA: PAS domain S-box protein [Candidatus Acidoferrales bacterium]|nr:PAS domain S-box protein [Candidatus Acidoferrales bacterium]